MAAYVAGSVDFLVRLHVSGVVTVVPMPTAISTWPSCSVPSVQAFPKLDILADLARAGFCDVDLVSLATDDIVLKHEAVRQNRLVYQTDDFDRGAYFSRIVRQFLDFRPYLETQQRAYKQRVLNGQSR